MVKLIMLTPIILSIIHKPPTFLPLVPNRTHVGRGQSPVDRIELGVDFVELVLHGCHGAQQFRIRVVFNLFNK